MTGECTLDSGVHPIKELASELQAAGLPVGIRQLRSACHAAKMPCRRLRNGRKWYASRVDARRYAENATETNVRLRPTCEPTCLFGDAYLRQQAEHRRRERSQSGAQIPRR